MSDFDNFLQRSFDTDLERYLAAYEYDLQEAEWWDANYPDWRARSIEPEDLDPQIYLELYG